ncbi:RNA polymerase subunit sigma-70 [Embleya scabrispora]|uniref:RNA polymerase subunit sigma-70 n=1 Tax=Embleya scabrispora TaxID=159449 RepID=A0A1T3NMK6_9ACTN|nr:RNA polymerase sigma factor SigJ [Embleya scabrispora]OPC77942.1 RNA polymerase subunit sigma-70 [Embleya scabrispora]
MENEAGPEQARPSGPTPRDAWLADRFEVVRPHLRTVAYGMLGSRTDAEDAIQETWLRVSRNEHQDIRDLRAWLTTVVGRICLDMLRARRLRREDYPGTWLPEPIVRPADADAYDPEGRAVEADAIGLALLIVLETLNPAERLAFVLHDVFGMTFPEIGRVVGRSPAAARQLASRARRRVRSAPQPDADLARQRRVVDAFLSAAREGDFDALLATLDPDVSFQVDLGPVAGPGPSAVVGAEKVARQMLANAKVFLPMSRPVLVNGSPGRLVGDSDAPTGIAGFTVAGDRIVRIDVVADPAKLRDVSLDLLDDLRSQAARRATTRTDGTTPDGTPPDTTRSDAT